MRINCSTTPLLPAETDRHLDLIITTIRLPSRISPLFLVRIQPSTVSRQPALPSNSGALARLTRGAFW